MIFDWVQNDVYRGLGRAGLYLLTGLPGISVVQLSSDFHRKREPSWSIRVSYSDCLILNLIAYGNKMDQFGAQGEWNLVLSWLGWDV